MLHPSSFITILALLVALSFNEASKDADLITALPGVDFTINFNQYSGYLTGVSDNYQLHYWFVEAQEKPETKPLILWLNGGPGCSSMEGFLTENGPFTVVEGKKLKKNEAAWNQLGNMLFLEAPAGVGFSFARDGNVTTDDILTAKNNVAALKSFVDRFPEYRGREFYITGESYGGVYVPTLAIEVLKATDLNLKLRGIAVGNGLTSYELNDNSLIYFAAYHGLIGDSIWQRLLNECCDDPTKLRCLFTRRQESNCQKLIYRVNNVINSGLDIYNLYSECDGGVTTLWNKWVTLNKGSNGVHMLGSGKMVYSDLGNLFRNNTHVKQQRLKSNQLRKSLLSNVKLAIPCVDDHVIKNYLNDPQVKNALHISPESASEWEVCSDKINAGYIRTYQELSQQYTDIVKSGVRTYLYNGDVDMACNFMGDEWFVDSLNFKIKDARRSWLYVEADGTKQVGGYVKKFVDPQNPSGTSLTFLTIRGSGHMAPTDRPLSTYHMFKSFMLNMDL